MTRYNKTPSGKYVIHGKTYEYLEGSRAQVYHGTAFKTSGGLKKGDIMMNKNGRIVSKSKHNTAKKERRLVKAGYGTKKGKFGYVKIGSKKSRSSAKGKSRRHRGGAVTPNSSGSSLGSSAMDVSGNLAGAEMSPVTAFSGNYKS
jgi:hypothetical protein